MPQLPYAIRSTLQPESGNLQEILSADEVDFSASRSLSPEGCGDELKSESSPDPASLRHLGSTRGLLEYASLDSNYGSTDRYARDSEGSELLGEVGDINGSEANSESYKEGTWQTAGETQHVPNLLSSPDFSLLVGANNHESGRYEEPSFSLSKWCWVWVGKEQCSVQRRHYLLAGEELR